VRLATRRIADIHMLMVSHAGSQLASLGIATSGIVA